MTANVTPTTSLPGHADLLVILRQWRTWYRVRRGLAAGQSGLIFGLSLALGFSLTVMLTGVGVRLGYGLAEYLRLLGWGSAAGSLGFGLAGFLWRLPFSQVARFFDAHFGLRERTATALEMMVNLPAASQHSPRFITLQLEDTLQAALRVQPNRNFFITIPRRQASLTLLLLALAAAAAFLARPYFERTAEYQAVQEAIEREIVELEALQQAVAEDPALSPEDKAALDARLQETIRQLQQAETLEQAIAALDQAEQELQAQTDQSIREQAQDLRQFGSQISQNDGSEPGGNPLQDFGKALSQDNPLQAAQELENLDLDSMSEAERQALAEQLRAGAESLQDTNPQLAEQMAQAAEALKNGDLQGAQQALSQSAQTLQQAGSQIARANQVQEAVQQAGESAERLIEAGQSAQADQAQAGDQSGEGTQAGQGQNPGQGQPGQGQGQPGSGDQPSNAPGSGAGQGSGDFGNLQGSESGDTPIDQNNSPGDGGERPYEALEQGTRLGGGGATEVYLPPSGAAGDEVTGQANTSPGTPGGSSVPYTQVYPAYAEAYRRAVESGQVPPELRNLVRDYFSSLEP